MINNSNVATSANARENEAEGREEGGRGQESEGVERGENKEAGASITDCCAVKLICMKKAGLIATLSCNVLIIQSRITKGRGGAFIKKDFLRDFERCTTISLSVGAIRSRVYLTLSCLTQHIHQEDS